MSTVTVTGYYEGIAYDLLLDDERVDDLTGVIVRGPAEVISAVEASTGTPGTLHPTGEQREMGVGSIEAVLTYLVNRTQVVDLTGDLPEDITGSEDDLADAVQ